MRTLQLCTLFLFSVIVFTGALAHASSVDSYYQKDTTTTQPLQLQQRFAFDPYPGPHAQTVNSILQKIADAMGKLRVTTNYTFRMLLKLVVEHTSGDRHRITAYPEDLTVTGDVLYRDFSLAKVLIPDLVDMRILVMSADGRLLAERAFKAADLSSEKDSLFEMSLDYDGSIEDVRVEIVDVFFYYDNRMDERFGLWTAALESYYDAGQRLTDVGKLIEGLNTAHVETLLLDEFNLCEAEAVLGDIMFAPFHSWIDFRDNDPEGIFPVYQSLKQSVDSLRADYNRAIAGIDSLFYQHGMNLLADSLPLQAREYFLSAMAYNPFHIPSHLALARLDVAGSDSIAALQRMARVYERMYPLDLMKAEADHFTDSVLGIFYDASWLLITEKRHAESLEVLAHVEQFCRHASPVYYCSPLFNMLFRQSHRGIYHSFLTVSQRALHNENLTLATTYLQNAIQYQRAYEEYIGDHFEALGLLSRVFTRYRIQYELKMLAGEVEAAETLKESALIIPEKQPGLLDFIVSRGTTEGIGTAVINYAVLGFPEESLFLLHRLKDRGLRSSAYIYHQRLAGAAWARYFKMTGEVRRPADLFNQLQVNDVWFDAFREAFLGNI
jgi:hypothetical protein